jgi:hypothetical protein
MRTDMNSSKASLGSCDSMTGVMQVDDQIWQVSWMGDDLGFFDTHSCRVEPGPNPLGSRVLTM